MSMSGYVPPSLYSVKVETRLVELGVVVRDSRGHTVGGLTRDDFEIEDGGKKREISAFSVETSVAPVPASASPAVPAATATAPSAPVPKPPARFLALVFDDLSMGPGDLIPTRKAAKRFVAQGLSPGDQVTVFFISKGQMLPFTDDVAKLNAALDGLNIATRNPVLPTCPNLTSYDAYVIATRQDPTLLPIKVAEAVSCGLCQRRDPSHSCSQTVEGLANRAWEEVKFTSLNTLYSLKAIVDYMAKLPGKRVMLMTSSGFLSGTLEYDREEIVDRALKGDVVINSLDAKGLYAQDLGLSSSPMNLRSTIARQNHGTRPQLESNDTMAILSDSTGGTFFHNNNDLDLGFRELGLAPQVSYSLAFAPGAADGKYHHLKVRLKPGNHYSLQARPGYFAAVASPTAPPVERRVDKELLAASALNEVPVSFSATPVKTPTGEPSLHVVLHLDVAHLPFANLFGARTEQLTVIAALFDDAGSFVTGRECEMNFNLQDKTFESLRNGMNAALTLNAPPGKYRLRGAVREGNEGKFATSSQAVEIQ